MKKLLKFLIVSIILVGILISALSFAYTQMTPKALGAGIFPLEERLNYCVGEQIQEISTDGYEKILVRTSRALNAYDIKTGSLIWTTPIKKQVQSFPPVPEGERVFAFDNEYLWAFDLETGSVLWKAPLDGNSSWIPDASERFVLLNSVSDSIKVYDAASGTKLWETLGGRGFNSAFIENNTIYIVDNDIKALDAVTGQLLWQITNTQATDLGALDEGVLFYVEFPGDQTFNLIAYSIETKTELWRKNISDNRPISLVVHDNALYMTNITALFKINSQTGKTAWVKKLSNPTNLSFIDDSVYVLEQFHRIIYARDLTNGIKIGSLQIAHPRVVSANAQEMVSVGKNLVFTRGCEIFVYTD